MNRNNNDILNELHNSGENCNPSYRLNPMAIEQSLKGVKRKTGKGVIGACVTLSVLCLSLAGVFSTMLYEQVTKPTLPIKTEIQSGGSYDDIYNVVNAIKKANEDTVFNKLEDSINQTLGSNRIYDSIAESSDSVTNSGSSDYSDTNVQVEGVDEADVVKTDGKYIYSVNDSNKIWITNPNNGEPKLVSSIEIDSAISDIYVYEDKLAILTDNYTTDYDMYEEDDIYEYSQDSNFAKVLIYDLSDINSPVQISSLSQSGNCLSSRRIDNVIYLTTYYTVCDFEHIEKDKPQTYCPIYGVNDKFECIESGCIVISENVESVNYVTVSSIDLNNPTDFVDINSALGAGSEIYASNNNLYVSANYYNEGITQTQIMRFSLNGTDIEPNGSLKVNGTVLNQFAMDEYNGYFRVVTETTQHYNYITEDVVPSESDTKTALYVFDSDLNLTGKTDNVAKGEYVKSVRFDGDIAYFVTFRQTDPLFTVDLSDPSSPQILSELKIPGFSEYLHVFGDGLLLGFGREADIETGGAEGLKLTMFDVSDKTNVTEIATRIFTNSEAYSDAEYNHKAIFVDEENSLIGIPYLTYEHDDYDYSTLYFYAIYEYDKENKDFILRKNIQLDEYSGSEYMRGLYIDDYFYIVTSERIYAYDYNTFEQASALVEKPNAGINWMITEYLLLN